MESSAYEHLGLRYLRVADSIRRMVLEGVYQPGDRMPRQHDLAKEHNVAFGTLKQALDLLEGEGYVVRKVGQGTYACLPGILSASVARYRRTIRDPRTILKSSISSRAECRFGIGLAMMDWSTKRLSWLRDTAFP